MRLTRSVFGEAVALVREATRHVLRHPVVGVAAAASTVDGRWLLIRRADSGGWALPGGTLEWGETLTQALKRELWEEAGARLTGHSVLSGVYSSPARDPRFHAVTVLVRATVEPPDPAHRPNRLEILESRLFRAGELPERLSHGMTDLLRDARAGSQVVE